MFGKRQNKFRKKNVKEHEFVQYDALLPSKGDAKHEIWDWYFQQNKGIKLSKDKEKNVGKNRHTDSSLLF